MTAFLTGQLALSRAACRDRRGALSALTEAERHLSRAASANSAIGAYHQASLAHQQAQTLARLGDLSSASRLAALSLGRRPPSERRSRALSTAWLAELRARQGHIEAACTAWDAFLDDYPQLSCARADAAFHTMRSRLGPYADAVPAARQLVSRATALALVTSPQRKG